jgi:hypothetical protein
MPEAVYIVREVTEYEVTVQLPEDESPDKGRDLAMDVFNSDPDVCRMVNIVDQRVVGRKK